MDFLDLIADDASVAVLLSLDDPADLARACSVSKSWYHLGKNNEIVIKKYIKFAPFSVF